MTDPLIIGHRGASAVAPENTLIAFDQAFAAGADGIEFDVQLALDGVPVVIHDSTLKRTGLRRDSVAKLTSKDLGRVDVGSWFNLRFPRRARAEYPNARVPTLANVFERFGDGQAVFYVELKFASKQSSSPAKQVAGLIDKYDIRARAVVVSFSLEAIREIKDIDPSIRTGALFEPRLTRPFPATQSVLARAIRYDADEVLWHRSMASAAAIEQTNLNGLAPTVWTADRTQWIARAQRDGIHAIITNEPERLILARDQLTTDRIYTRSTTSKS